MGDMLSVVSRVRNNRVWTAVECVEGRVGSSRMVSSCLSYGDARYKPPFTFVDFLGFVPHEDVFPKVKQNLSQ